MNVITSYKNLDGVVTVLIQGSVGMLEATKWCEKTYGFSPEVRLYPPDGYKGIIFPKQVFLVPDGETKEVVTKRLIKEHAEAIEKLHTGNFNEPGERYGAEIEVEDAEKALLEFILEE